MANIFGLPSVNSSAGTSDKIKATVKKPIGKRSFLNKNKPPPNYFSVDAISTYGKQFEVEDLSLQSHLDKRKSSRKARQTVTKRKAETYALNKKLKRDSEIFSLKTELKTLKASRIAVSQSISRAKAQGESRHGGHTNTMNASSALKSAKATQSQINKREQEVNLRLMDLGIQDPSGLVGKKIKYGELEGRQNTKTKNQFDQDIMDTEERIKELEHQEKNLKKAEQNEFLNMTSDQTIPQQRHSNLTGGTVAETRGGIVRDGGKVFKKNDRNSIERNVNRKSFRDLGLG